MKISVVMPNYNGLELLKENLPKILDAVKGFQIVIVDDGSTDESVAYLKNHFPKITVVEKVTNSGFATSINLGVKAAFGDIVVLLNTDTQPKSDFIEPLIKHFSDDKLFAVGCLDNSVERNNIVQRGRGIGLFGRGFLMHKRGDINKNDTLWVNAGSGAFRKSLWLKLDGMDENYDPFYWEDIDLSYRALKSGYKLVFEPNSVIEHRHAQGSINTHFGKQEINQIAYRNQFLFVWKNITSINYLLQHILWLPYHLVSRALQGDVEFMKGFLTALVKLPEVLKKRSRVVKLFTKTDEEVLASFSL